MQLLEAVCLRMDKYLSLLGHTRRQAKALCAAGRVRMDGAQVRDASTHVAQGAVITLDGTPLAVERHVHLMVHKPEGYLTATFDARGKPTVLDLIPQAQRRADLGPVGRLDKDVSGLVLLTTDGQLAHRLISPRWTVEKRYLATVFGVLDDSHVRRMAEGVPLKGFTARPARLTVLSSGARSEAELIVTEGKYHQVKRMFGALGRPVLALKRLSIGGVELDGALSVGAFRPLSDAEAAHLYQLVSLNQE